MNDKVLLNKLKQLFVLDCLADSGKLIHTKQDACREVASELHSQLFCELYEDIDKALKERLRT